MAHGNQNLQLRPAADSDHDAIAELWHGSASLPTVGPPVMPTLAELRERVGVEFATGWSVTVAIHDGEVVGFLALRPDRAVLDQLFVRPGSIGAGVGTALLAHAKAVMPRGFTLFTRPANERACRFYEKAGLVPLRTDKHPGTGDPIVYYGWKAA